MESNLGLLGEKQQCNLCALLFAPVLGKISAAVPIVLSLQVVATIKRSLKVI